MLKIIKLICITLGPEIIMKIKNVKAILFDVFGTVVDWRGSITRMGEDIAKIKGIKNIDWPAFANAWRAGYKPGMAKVQSGEQPWTSIDTIHRTRLDHILVDFGIAEFFTEEEKSKLNKFWHYLDPWPDSIPGLIKLKQFYLIGPLSNGSLTLLSSMAKRANIPWDFIFSSDIFKAYKPDSQVYLGAINFLGLQPEEVMMAAAHNEDLEAARFHGMATAYVNRPYEYGPAQKKDLHASQDWDIITDSIIGISTEMT